MGETSQADLIRVDIEQKIAEDYDFSKTSFKQKAVNDFVENHPKLNTNVSKCKKAYYNILKEFEKSGGLKVASNKKRLLKPNPQMISGDMDATINPVPQQVQQPQLVQTPQVAGMPPTQEAPMMVQHDIEGVSASINAFYIVVRMAFAPEADLLSESEKKSLGAIWLPIFNKYLQDEKSIIAVAVASSLGIIVPKLAKGRALMKSKEPKKEETKEEKEEKILDPTINNLEDIEN